MILNEKSSYNLTPPSGFVETFYGELIILGIGAAGYLLATLDLAEWLNWVGGVPAFIAFLSLFSFVPSMISYLSFISDKASYYSKLKSDIIKSNNYNEFTNLRNKR